MPPRLKELAVARAREQNISFGEFVRRAVAQQLASSPKGAAKKTKDPFWDNMKTFAGGPADLSTRLDEFLYGGKE